MVFKPRTEAGIVRKVTSKAKSKKKRKLKKQPTAVLEPKVSYDLSQDIKPSGGLKKGGVIQVKRGGTATYDTSRGSKSPLIEVAFKKGSKKRQRRAAPVVRQVGQRKKRSGYRGRRRRSGLGRLT